MGNFSRDTFDRLKHYVGVRLQQGVPLVDADWNEQEDIRKFELQTFLKWFAGNGVPQGNNGFAIQASSPSANNFAITGGDGTAEGAGRCLVEGADIMNESTIRYTDQPLYNNATLAGEWGVDPVAPMTTPASDRIDAVYVDVWEREVDSSEDGDLVNPAIGLETCVRRRREWAVRVAQGASSPPAAPAGHDFYLLALLKRPGGTAGITNTQISDERTTGINLAGLAAEIEDARGMKANLGNRLDESLTKGGQLRFNVVANDQVQAGAAINESKILFSPTGHDHSGGSGGNQIGAGGLENNAVSTAKIANLAVTAAKIADNGVTAPKIANNAVTKDKIAGGSVNRNKLDLDVLNSGSVVDLAPGASNLQLVESNVNPLVGVKRVYMPVIAITSVTGGGVAYITHQLVYRGISGSSNYNVYIRITNEAGGSELADIAWYVYVFGED